MATEQPTRNNRRWLRRQADRSAHVCPMTPDQVSVLIKNNEEVLKRLAAIERSFFVQKIIARTLMCVVVALFSTFEWVRSNVVSLKDFLNHVVR